MWTPHWLCVTRICHVTTCDTVMHFWFFTNQWTRADDQKTGHAVSCTETVPNSVYHWGNSLQVEMLLSFLQKQTSIYRLQTWVSFHEYIYRYFARTSDKPVIYSAFVRFKCIRRYINGYTHRSCSIAISLKAPHKLAFTITVEIENLREMSPIVQRLFLNCAYNIFCFGVFRRISVSIGSNGYCVDRVSR